MGRTDFGTLPRAKIGKHTSTAAGRADDVKRREAVYREGFVDGAAQKDAAYEERNRVVAALARLFPSGLAKTDIPGWEPEWHGCVYIDLPTGQVSWHFHDSQAYLFDGLPPYTKPWDEHDTEEKYRRVAALHTKEAARRIEEAMKEPP